MCCDAGFWLILVVVTLVAQRDAPPQSTALHLFVPCANAATESGTNRDAWVPNPGASTPLDIQMFEFLGKLLVSAHAMQ